MARGRGGVSPSTLVGEEEDLGPLERSRGRYRNRRGVGTPDRSVLLVAPRRLLDRRWGLLFPFGASDSVVPTETPCTHRGEGKGGDQLSPDRKSHGMIL